MKTLRQLSKAKKVKLNSVGLSALAAAGVALDPKALKAAKAGLTITAGVSRDAYEALRPIIKILQGLGIAVVCCFTAKQVIDEYEGGQSGKACFAHIIGGAIVIVLIIATPSIMWDVADTADRVFDDI